MFIFGNVSLCVLSQFRELYNNGDYGYFCSIKDILVALFTKRRIKTQGVRKLPLNFTSTQL